MGAAAIGSVRGDPAAPGRETADEAFQSRLLEGVSRTFALTIPELPDRLRSVVANAYLLCRIVDTIEDEPKLDPREKRRFAERFVSVVAGSDDAHTFAAELKPKLSASTIPAEHVLIGETPRVVAITHALAPAERDALERCVGVMAKGMAAFQERAGTGGLRDLADLDAYCYHVAGVVGEMLTALFCHYSPEIARQRAGLDALSRSFGQGLQMTNILKDLWDDRERGVSWLPQDVFREAGVDVSTLASGSNGDPGFGRALARLIGIAHAHLRGALAYVLLLPKQERGIRTFCLWAIGLALLTLQKINRHRDFTAGSEVKIARSSVWATRALTRMSVTHDLALRSLFALAGWGLP